MSQSEQDVTPEAGCRPDVSFKQERPKPTHPTGKSAYDDVLVLLGDFGPYHIRAFILLAVLNIYSGFPICIVILLFLDVPFRCSVPGLPNDTFHIQDESHQRLVNASIPYDVTTGLYSQCSAYLSEEPTINATVPCSRWVYDNDYAVSSFVPHLDLVCDRRYIKTQFITALSVGLVIAVVGSGPAADAFGRKKPMLLFLVVNSVCILIMTPITYIPLMLVLCCILCAAIMAAFLISFTQILEIIGPSKRPLASLGIELGWSVGLLLATPYIYLIYDWQISSYSIAAMGFVFVAYFWILDESPRWLLTKNKIDEAMEIFRRMAKVNKVKLNDLDGQITSLVTKETEKEANGQRRLIKDLVALVMSRSLFVRVFALSFIWFSLILAYSGMTYNIGEMIEGDVYSNFALQAGMEFLGYLCAYFLTRYFGRRTLHFSFTLASSISFLVSALSGLVGIGTNWIPILTFATGKFAVTGSLFMIYTIANELMPTVVRNTSVGVCCCIGLSGSVAATQMTMLPDLIPTTFGKTLPLFLFSAFLLVSALLTLVLPETKNKELPDTIQEAKSIGRNHQKKLRQLQVFDTENGLKFGGPD